MPSAPPIKAPCGAHAAAPSVATCAFCGTRLCTDCFRFTVDERASCTLCARSIATLRRRRYVMACVLVAAAALGGVSAYRARADDHGLPWIELGLATGLFVMAITIAHRAQPSVDARAVFRRSKEPEPALPRAAAVVGTRYAPIVEPELGPESGPGRRQRITSLARRAGAALVPSLSARAATAAALAVLAFVTLAVPAALHLPRWIEIEALLGLVYVILGGFLSVLLFRGYRFVDDHVFVGPSLPWETPRDAIDPKYGKPPPARRSAPNRDDVGQGCDGFSGCGDVGEAGSLLVGLMLVAIAAVVALFAAWLLVEVALPLVFLLAYRGLFRGVSLVAHDDHGCEGSLVASLVWGYVAALLAYFPLASITFVVHRLIH